MKEKQDLLKDLLETAISTFDVQERNSFFAKW